MIFASGALDGKFARKATGTADRAEARRIAEVYEQADSWTGQPKPKPSPIAPTLAPEKTRITVEDACKVFVTNRQSTGVAAMLGNLGWSGSDPSARTAGTGRR